MSVPLSPPTVRLFNVSGAELILGNYAAFCLFWKIETVDDSQEAILASRSAASRRRLLSRRPDRRWVTPKRHLAL